MRILGISGSLRRDSYNTRLLHAAGEILAVEAKFVAFDGLRHVPPFDEDFEDAPQPAGVAHLREEIAAADGLLIATPEYNSSIPGQLKNALDWASRPLADNVLRNKNAAVIGASTSLFGAVWAQAETRKVLAAAGARVLDRDLPLPEAHKHLDDAGHLQDEAYREELADLLVGLLAQVEASAAVLAA